MNNLLYLIGCVIVIETCGTQFIHQTLSALHGSRTGSFARRIKNHPRISRDGKKKVKMNKEVDPIIADIA